MSGIDFFRVLKVLRFWGVKVFVLYKLSFIREGGRKGMSGMGNWVSECIGWFIDWLNNFKLIDWVIDLLII